MIAEELLHFVWQLRLFNQFELRSQTGEKIKILHTGWHNRNAGPDFMHSHILIDDYDWHGHVEIHVDSADWRRHQHDRDPAYNNVILHVVYKKPMPVTRADGTIIPTLVLKEHVDGHLLDTYADIMKGFDWIPCARHLPAVEMPYRIQMLDRALSERLETRAADIQTLSKEMQGDWERVLFVMVCRAFGMKVNADTFFDFGRALNFNLVKRYHQEPLKLEAYFFGMAGMLRGAKDDSYLLSLQREYGYLQVLHNLTDNDHFQWKFLRMRPFNFPTIRMAQLAALYGETPYWFQRIKSAEQPKDIFSLFEKIKVNLYWQSHFLFAKETKVHRVGLTETFASHILINAFIPVMYSYALLVGEEALRLKALGWLTHLPAEKNKVTTSFDALGVPIHNAADSQAALQVYQHYCTHKQCLRCAIGTSLFRR
ncbi:DUF2851 family protein [Sphingobacterium psychroaquaticum]|uniref:DUF2851 domain-containing protein n=1 Tax=Sphingobacterium psychroaquaticum TaxID=561061 RepID=A0A1X7IF84_9SPHI|nr:DUF2851 family protein [Sphingobacterium psychroaquaticum]SMG13265.1 Protein of unknown function [Sphingobacterium psychroaquaticum]